MIARDYELSVSERRVTCDAFTLESCEGEIRIEDIFVSEQYGIKREIQSNQDQKSLEK